MAKLKGPLFSLGAHGSVNKSLNYSQRKGKNLLRKFSYPKKAVSLKQWTQRHIIGLLTAHWQIKTNDEKKTYNDLAAESGLNISGFNYFLKVAQQDLYTHHGLCGYWSMNESTGNQALDYSGNGNHGSLLPSYPDNCPTREAAMIKQYGNALSFDGINDRVNCGSDPSLDFTDAFTLSAWLKVPHTETADKIFTKGLGYPAGEAKGWGIEARNDNKIYFYIATSTGGNTHREATFPLEKWFNLVCILDNNIGKIYIDNVFLSSLPVDGYTDADELSLFFGSASWGEYARCKMDEVCFYNRALGEEEIKKHYELLRLDKKRQPLIIH